MALVVGLVAGLVLAPVGAVLTAAPASAATTPVGTIQASFAHHRGTNGSGTPNPAGNNATANCIRFDPAGGAWSSTSARAAHGNQAVRTRTRIFGFWLPWQDSWTCPTALGGGYETSTSNREEYSRGQSILGMRPASPATVESGRPFLVGTFHHDNNPVTATASFFEGTFGLRIGPVAAPLTLSATYVLHETANSAGVASDPANNDTVTFTNLVRTETMTINGLTYRLDVHGFTTAGTGDVACGSAPGGPYSDVVSTVEETTTVACLWAQLDQVRTLTLVKQVAAAGDAPATVPATTLSTTTSLPGSPWAGVTETLRPAATTGSTTAAGAARAFRSTGERVVVTAGAPPTGWALEQVTCRDGSGGLLSTGVAVDLTAARLVLENVPDATTAAQVPITCTFLDVYVAPTVLTLVSRTIPSGTSWAPTAGWSFTVDALAAPLVTGGATGAASATVAVPGATRSIQVTETVPAGYVFDKAVCTSSGGATVTSTANPLVLTLDRGRSYMCTVDNLRPGVTLTKRAYLQSDTTFAAPLAAGQPRAVGTAVVWRYTVTNTGQTPLRDVVLRDDVTVTRTGSGTSTGRTTIACPGRPDLPAGQAVTIPTLAVGASVTCQASGVL